MVYRPNIDSKLCFVLMPFRDPFTGYYTQIIKPAISKLGLAPLRADEIYGTRSIIRDIWESIWQARLIVADVTDKNPNVNYELGICHTLGVPTVLLAKRIEDVPFDYQHRRCIIYQTDQAGWENRLRHSLERTIESALNTSQSEEELPWPYSTFLRASKVQERAEINTQKDSRESKEDFHPPLYSYRGKYYYSYEDYRKAREAAERDNK